MKCALDLHATGPVFPLALSQKLTALHTFARGCDRPGTPTSGAASVEDVDTLC